MITISRIMIYESFLTIALDFNTNEKKITWKKINLIYMAQRRHNQSEGKQIENKIVLGISVSIESRSHEKW